MSKSLRPARIVMPNFYTASGNKTKMCSQEMDWLVIALSLGLRLGSGCGEKAPITLGRGPEMGY